MADPAAHLVTDEAQLLAAPERPVRLILGKGEGAAEAVLVECFTLESGRAFVDHRLSQSAQGAALRPTGDWLQPAAGLPEGWEGWTVLQRDPHSGIAAEVTIARPPGTQALRLATTVRNEGEAPVHLTACSMLSATLLPASAVDDIDVIFGRSAWMAEGRWQRQPLDDHLVDITPHLHGESARDCLRLSAESGWSSGRFAPVGFVEDRKSGAGLGWQVEHNGGWTVELSRRTDQLAIACYGPTDLQHHWMRRLAPGEQFTTPHVAVAVADHGWEGAAAELTKYRRALRVSAGCTEPTAPVVYNDYLNTLMADPTTDKLMALIPAAASVGVEVFCIDAGWFAELGDDWWGAVGEWLPSTTRFSGGLDQVLAAIRSHGMVPGLWIEPLALGCDSPVAGELSGLCMTRAGVPVVEQNRLRIDMRKQAARDHLDAVLDRMVGYGIGYLKIDDNFSAGSGPDEEADSPGDGMLEHSRAWAAWLAQLGRRHPGLIIENCASGAMTTDYALLAHARVQSTSDLQDMTKYPTIAAAAPLVVLPEQAGNWGVPQPGMTAGELVSTLVTSLAGTLYLSGHLDRLDERGLALVREAVTLARAERNQRPHRRPHWPLGLPGWKDEWVALAELPLEDCPDQEGLLFLWHRARPDAASAAVSVPTRLKTCYWELGEQLFPAASGDEPWHVTQQEQAVRLSVAPSSTTARVYRIRQHNHHGGVEDAALREES